MHIGESLSINISFNPEYDKSRIQDLILHIGKFNVGSLSEGEIVVDSEQYRCAIKSEKTALFEAKKEAEITLTIDDSHSGIIKEIVGNIDVLRSNSNFKNDSVNTGTDIVITCNILDTVQTFSSEITAALMAVDLSDYALKTDLHEHENKSILDEITEELDKKQTVFTGICQKQYITENDIVIDANALTLTIATVKNGQVISENNPICFYTDGNGESVKHVKSSSVVFDFTSNAATSGVKYFYFNSNGDPIVSDSGWTDFSNIAPVYRFLWNTNLTGNDRIVIESIEFHKNDISWADHSWKHSEGTRWINGFEITHNRLTSGSPAADGSNTCIALSTGTNLDDNLFYTVTNTATPSEKFTQNLGTGTTTSLSGKFIATYNLSALDLRKIPATDFPFVWNSSTNTPEYINAGGIRSLVSNGYFFVNYVYALQDPRVGETVKIRSAEVEFSTLALAQAHNWEQLQAIYPTLKDSEIRILYKCIFEYRSTYNIGCKKSVLRQVDDLRKQKTTTTSIAGGIVLSTNVQTTPTSNFASTNLQSALDEFKRRERVLLLNKTNDGSVSLDFSYEYQYLNVSGGSDSVTNNTFNNLPVTSSILNSFKRELTIKNTRLTNITISPNTANIVQSGVTYTFLYMDYIPITVLPNKSVELIYKFIFTSATTCDVRIKYFVQS